MIFKTGLGITEISYNRKKKKKNEEESYNSFLSLRNVKLFIIKSHKSSRNEFICKEIYVNCRLFSIGKTLYKWFIIQSLVKRTN